MCVLLLQPIWALHFHSFGQSHRRLFYYETGMCVVRIGSPLLLKNDRKVVLIKSGFTCLVGTDEFPQGIPRPLRASGDNPDPFGIEFKVF